jgi:hypothetical protein
MGKRDLILAQYSFYSGARESDPEGRRNPIADVTE